MSLRVTYKCSSCGTGLPVGETRLSGTNAVITCPQCGEDNVVTVNVSCELCGARATSLEVRRASIDTFESTARCDAHIGCDDIRKWSARFRCHKCGETSDYGNAVVRDGTVFATCPGCGVELRLQEGLKCEHCAEIATHLTDGSGFMQEKGKPRCDQHAGSAVDVRETLLGLMVLVVCLVLFIVFMRGGCKISCSQAPRVPPPPRQESPVVPSAPVPEAPAL